MQQDASCQADQEYRFGPFRFHAGHHALFSPGGRIGTSRQALALLAVLVEGAGRLVGTAELMARVWPGTAMNPNNLAVHIGKLRKALGDDPARPAYIATVNGRGYRFVAPVAMCGKRAAAPYALPAPPERALGRDDALRAVLGLCARRRLVTIVGPGGIGKTVFALTLAGEMAKTTSAAARFVDLGIHGDACRTIRDALSTLDAPGRTILVLDSCEHMDEAGAALLGEMLATVPGVRVVAASRTPLGITGEALHWLAPLACPAADAAMTAAHALQFPAVALFAERAARRLRGYRLRDPDAGAVAAICARLEGHPLAIDLAARRMEALAASEIAARLDDRLGLLRAGPRHGGLAAAFDRSYAALPAAARRILLGLAVLPDAFTLDAAARLLAWEAMDAIVEGIGELVANCLLQATPSATDMRYRLSATIKPYVLDKLDEVNAQRALLPGRTIRRLPIPAPGWHPQSHSAPGSPRDSRTGRAPAGPWRILHTGASLPGG